VYPTVGVPLQEAGRQLRRWNGELRDHIEALNARARILLDAASATRCAAAELASEVEANRRYRHDMDAGIESSQRELLVLQDAVAAEGSKLKRLQLGIVAVETQRAVADAQVEAEQEVIYALHLQQDALDVQRERLEQDRARVRAECAVKGEVVALTCSLLAAGGDSKRPLLLLSLRAMQALASRPGTV
jgi:chromosome segregation ATPase